MKLAYSVPCPTLTSICTSGNQGLNVCMVASTDTDAWMSILVWDLSTSSDFKREGLRLRYRIRLNGPEIEVRHGHR